MAKKKKPSASPVEPEFALDLYSLDRTEFMTLVLIMFQQIQILGKALGRAFDAFPDNYAVFDVETSGVDKSLDLVCQLGYCLVVDGKEQERICWDLDWSDPALVDQRWLRDKLLYTKEQVEMKDGTPTGKTYHVSYERMREGVPPVEALREFLDLLIHMREEGFVFVAHNGVNFDAPILANHFKRWLGEDFAFGPNEIWDTGMIEKAIQLNMVPEPGDTFRSFAGRVGGVRAKGVYWALDRHCVPKYDLAKRFGLDMDMAHDAGFDCYVTHLLFEDYKRIALNGKVASSSDS